MITKHREQGLQMAELTINADDVRNALNDFAASYEPSGTDRTEVGRVISAADGIARVEGLPSVMANELLRFENGGLGLAQDLDVRDLGVVVLGDFAGIEEGMEVRRTGEVLSVPVGDNFLGRVVNPLGEPVDGLGEIQSEGRRALDLSVLLISGCTALLTVLGLVMVLSSSSVEAIGTGGGSYALFLRQTAWAVAGVAALLVFSRLPVRVFKALAWPAFGVAVILLALVAFSPLGVTVGGNRNWLGIGGFRMQPSEAAKLALALWAAAVLERKHRLVTQVRHALIPVLPGGLLLLGLVMAGSDLGTAIILALVLATVLYVAGTHWGVFLTFLALSVLGILALTLLAPHRMVRVQAWMGDCSDATDPCFQPAHGMYALASGGWWGAGLGQSRQKWSYIPEAENDFIFTILGEELGLVGTLVVLLAYLGLAIGIYRVAAGTTSTFIRATSVEMRKPMPTIGVPKNSATMAPIRASVVVIFNPFNRKGIAAGRRSFHRLAP